MHSKKNRHLCYFLWFFHSIGVLHVHYRGMQTAFMCVTKKNENNIGIFFGIASRV